MKNFIGKICVKRVEIYEFKARDSEDAKRVLDDLELNGEPTDEYNEDEKIIEIEEMEA
jgi:hypothetical protein